LIELEGEPIKGIGGALRQIVVADRHPLFAEALESMLRRRGLSLPIGRAVSLSDLLDNRVDALLLVNLGLPEMRGVVGLETLLRRRSPHHIVVMLDEDDPGLVLYCQERGVAAIVVKTDSADRIRAELRSVLEGCPPPPPRETTADAVDSLTLYRRLASLSPKQAEVLSFLREGLLNKQIAHELGLTEATVKHHISLILKKLGCYRRTQAVAIANRLSV
jgi:DNA-binding NarL/FixJ family response regulator